MSHEEHVFPVPEAFAKDALIDDDRYAEMYARSINDPDGFWREHGMRITWSKPFTQVKDVSWDKNDLHVKWFADGELNISANCIDCHLPERRMMSPSSGKVMTPPNPSTSHIANYMNAYVASPMC